MSLEIFEKVKNFLVRIVKDEDFRAQLMSEKAEEVRKALEDGGYKFSQAEFETAAIKILELKESGEFDELSEEELVGAFGGLTTISEKALQRINAGIFTALTLKPWPGPIVKLSPQPQPLYGIFIQSIADNLPAQSLYGSVVVLTDQIQ